MEKQNLSYETQQKHSFTNQKKCTTTQNKHKKLKPGLVAFYDIRPGNEQGLFWFRCFINLWLTYLLRHLPTYLQLLPPDGISPRAKFTLHPSLAFSYIGSVTAWHSSSGVRQTLWHGTRNGITELSQRAPPTFGWAAITLGIGPHSSLVLFFSKRSVKLELDKAVSEVV